ncbi:MAG: hypothetical protein OEM07_05130 [Gammaproteobacteria bacterium]|nr:hypothetical protein [Gammaproteobacteria bacterium]
MRNLIISILLYSFAGYANALDCNSILSKSDIEQFSGEEAALPRKQPAPDDDTCHMNIRVFVPGASYNTSYAYYWSKMGESDAKSIYEEEKNWEPKDAIKMLADLGTSAYWIEHEKNNHSIRIHIPSGYLKVSCNFGRSDGYCNKDKVVDLARIALAHAKGETISVVKKEPVQKK